MGAFQDVRAAFCSNTKESLERIGVVIAAKAAQPRWIAVRCPLCPDTSGSASVANENAHLVCHQCGIKEELFRWVAKKENFESDWEACKWLAERFNVNLEIQYEKRGRPSAEVSPSFVKAAQRRLFEDPEAQSARDFLLSRSLGQDQALTEQLGVGFHNGKILFFQFDKFGNCKDRYRVYSPATKKWGWSKGEDDALGFWPGIPVEGKDKHIWILEGEWDAWTGRERLRLQDQDVHCYTWTGGASSPLRPEAVPTRLRGQYIHILYDNDTFQGPDLAAHYAPDDKKLAELKRRRENLIHGVAGVFKSLDCQVWLHAVPIPAEKQWGADFRDWVDGGGRDLSQIPGWPLREVLHARKIIRATSLNKVYRLADSRVKFSCVVNHLEEEGVVIPKTSHVDCERGQHNYCKKCKVLVLAADGVLHWDNMPEDQANAVLSGDAELYAKKRLFGVPGSCNRCVLTTKDYRIGSIWSGVEDDAKSASGKELLLLSHKSPALSDELEVIGDVYHHKNTVAVGVKRLNVLDRTDIDFNKIKVNLLELTPWQTNDPAVIHEYLTKRAVSLADNVTHIYGREDVHTVTELVTHSALWMNMDGHRRRAWLDISIIGPTRVGKSMTVRHLMEYHGLGAMHTCLENISRAGLTMGAIQGREKMRMKPGLFPRSHKKMLVLDEFHTMVPFLGRNPILDVMSARDAGTVGGVKIYGAKVLPAAVRLITICNWVRGRVETYEFPCQHFLHLYGAPESLSRLDFGLVVPEAAMDLDVAGSGSEHVWNRELMRALILRAWGQKPDHLHFDADAIDLAKTMCTAWEAEYCETLPLFIKAEKHFSVLRIAVAVANMRASHIDGHFTHCWIRPADVEVAANILQGTWKNNSYDLYSKAAVARREVPKCFHVEAEVLCSLGLHESESVRNLLPNLFGPLHASEIGSTIGMDFKDSQKWISAMIRLNAVEKVRAERGRQVEWRLTPGAHQIVKNLILLAEEYPDEINRRFSHLNNWRFGNTSTNPDLIPMNLSIHELRAHWRDHASNPSGHIYPHPSTGTGDM